ncbi:RNA-directed DNA polymerase, eukaryota, Reverse transcriptase zinc-binding domain protein [Artemisia annua]|uniref:RNA-directed DNA polymerase, eukaryota, Reverse transcriptase zinc-binding domain protein n=1 Tax=Artemisia annua TaxID=35608 RepID=A0A2U1KCL3_ARTAN|nr:RNA-directed DNA polymerase, eukaryota, Reverse transcriptase zinc-binding domain protein [Artemisia annua]
MFLCNLGKGNNISFWKDLWYGDTPLLLRWPFLFSVEKDKECVVSSRVSYDGSRNNLTTKWSAGAYTVAGISETQDVMFMLSHISFKDSRDRWFWDFNQPVEFSVAAVKESMQENLYSSDGISFLWVNWVPIKVNTLVWRIVKGRISTRVELCKRKIVLPCYSCPMCRLEDETVSHILFDCRFAFEVWTKVWLWSRLNHSDFGSLEDVIHWPNSRNISVVKKKRIRGENFKNLKN